jgi:integrase
MNAEDGWGLVDFWLSRLGDNTAKVYSRIFKNWIDWINENSERFKDATPDQLIQYQLDSDNGSKYHILNLIQRYIQTIKSSSGYKRKIYTVVKSFFLHNRTPLPPDPAFNMRGDKPRTRGTLTPDEIKQMVLGSKPMYQAAFLCMFQGGMGTDEFIYWSNHGLEDLKQALKEDPKIIKIDLPGRKKAKYEKSYYTFIGPDAIEYLKKWMQQRPEDSPAIFTDQYRTPLTQTGLYHYWNRLTKRIGIVKPMNNGSSSSRYGKNPHEMRDVFRSQWGISTAKPSVGEFLMGHVIDPYEYDKSYRNVDAYRREYLKALPKLQIISSGEPFGRVEDSKVKQLEDEVEKLREQLQKSKTSRNGEVKELQGQVNMLREQLLDLQEAMNLFFENPELAKRRMIKK